jgi:isopentenyldiphosphate isomerase
MTANLAATDDWGELLDVLDPGDPTGSRVIARYDRLRVHREGLLHRSVHVCVVRSVPDWPAQVHGLRNTNYKLLLQRRSESKAIAPGCWDLSCAEHLRAGESFEAAAVRGLQEELGLALAPDQQTTPIHALDDGEPALQLYDYPSVGLTDYEWNRIYVVFVTDQADEALVKLKLDSAEVAQVRWITRESLQMELAENPSHFTPWFRDQARKHLLPSAYN